MKLAMLVSAVLAVSPCASAQTVDGKATGFLLEACNAPEESPAGRYCLGYVLGMGTVMAANGREVTHVATKDAEAKLHLASMGICPDADIGVPSGMALMQAFKNWAQQHPEAWDRPAMESVPIALGATWRCRIPK